MARALDPRWRSVVCSFANFLLCLCATLAFAPALAGAPADNPLADGGNSPGYDMAPETRLEVVQAAVAAIPDKLPPGPFKPDWESLAAHYQVPQWFVEARFGLMMHWGVYAVPAYHNEWYEKHMYD